MNFKLTHYPRVDPVPEPGMLAWLAAGGAVLEAESFERLHKQFLVFQMRPAASRVPIDEGSPRKRELLHKEIQGRLLQRG